MRFWLPFYVYQEIIYYAVEDPKEKTTSMYLDLHQNYGDVGTVKHV